MRTDDATTEGGDWKRRVATPGRPETASHPAPRMNDHEGEEILYVLWGEVSMHAGSTRSFPAAPRRPEAPRRRSFR